MKTRRLSRLLAVLILTVMSGCQSYTIVQRNVFSDDDGNILTVEYGYAESEHVSTYVWPLTGKEMEFRSKLLVIVRMPDGEEFKAWECENYYQSRGTMYKTDDETWMFLANGFSSLVYEQTESDKTKYLEVYRGILCDTVPVENDYNSKWKKVNAPQTGRYSSKEEKKTDESAR